MSIIFITLSGIIQLIVLSHLGEVDFATKQYIHIEALNLNMGSRGLMILSIIFMVIAFVMELAERIDHFETKRKAKAAERENAMLKAKSENKSAKKITSQDAELEALKSKSDNNATDNLNG